MTCSNKGCKIKAKINPKSGLCPSCDEFVQNVNRRVEGLDWREQSRDQSHAAHRDLGKSPDRQQQEIRGSAPHAPPENNVVNYPSLSNNQTPLPNVDLNGIKKTCEDAKNGVQVDTGKVLGDMLGMIVHMYAKQSENDDVKEQVEDNTDRIGHLEAKVGDANDVAYPRSIAIRKLPLTPHGVSELQNVQHYLKEINAEGVDVVRDCIKAIRKESMKHNPNFGPNLGTVLVELKSEEIRGKIMKANKNIMNHQALVLQNLIIKNTMSPAEMKAQNTHLGMLKMITGSSDFFIAGNGMIRQKDQQNFQHENEQARNRTNQMPQYQRTPYQQHQNQSTHIPHQNQPTQPQHQNQTNKPHHQNQTTQHNHQSQPNQAQHQNQPTQSHNQHQNQPKPPQLHPVRFQTPNFVNSQPFKQQNSFAPSMFPQSRPSSLQTNFPPYFQQQFQFPAQLPVINPMPSRATVIETDANLLDFDFGQHPAVSDESRPSSAHSARSLSPTPGSSRSAQHQEASTMQ